MTDKHTDEEFAARWRLAQELGWRFSVPEDIVPACVCVSPPFHHPCLDRVATLETFTWLGLKVIVPSYFWDDSILRLHGPPEENKPLHE